uniref:Protein transport protein Sec16B n=1 Tax=Gallus gallus TaxID=9031 RepID=SC16B_CHICK|nr:RecName: Full=Protein transport protein Sec16B; AltName: Full=Regucalcin gene promoter region-related protein p117; Short=RGPR-p117; AltName: Full=SEC16 homolog B [Gallus gallus]BAD34968.1 regucalcin gene promotor region related protein [Gallus gallus]|eukprot:NP_001026440.1 protein transport protein Sec16B [Gallus gallus]
MEPWDPPQLPPVRHSHAAGSGRAEGRHGTPPPWRPIISGPLPRPGSWDPGRDLHRPASQAESYESGHAFRAYSRQGYEDPHWQYPGAAYRDNHAYQSHQWQPTAWQGNRDVTQVKPHGKSTTYRDQHYYRGYHPNLAASPLGQDRSQTYDAYKEGSRRSWAGVSNLGEASGQPQQPSLLQQYRESGLSSSGYELSQYIRDGAEPNDTAFLGGWSPVQGGGPLESAVMAPHKFLQPHVPVCLGAGGQLVLVCPHRPTEGQLPLVELHSLEVILQGTTDQEELQAFPGPLAREDLHKVDVMTFCQQKIASSCDLSTQRGRDSALLWKLLVLLCRQNGSMVGSDVAELLMQDCRQQERYKRQEPAVGPVSLADEEWRQLGTLDLITGEVPPVVETQAQIVEKFTKLLYYGRKKDALVWAMRNQLWGHALFLSSKMDPRTYSWVLSGFTSTLATNDPLQTFFQLMSGRIPQAAQSCGDAKWGDWRPHLAVLLSNKVGDMELNHRAIVTMGDTLAGKGAVEAAHFCYLMADIPFGYFGVKADRMALLGSSHRQAFTQFATKEAIQRMEIFEYCQQLRHPTSFLLPFQVYKLLYASRLADHGLPAQALLYCEQIATVLLQQDPTSHPVLAQQLTKLAERLKLCDPLLLLEMPEQDPVLEPQWLLQLRTYCQHCQVQDDLAPEVALTQPEPWDTTATPGREMVHEQPHSDGPHDEQWHQPPVPLQGPDPHQDVSIPPLEVAVLGVGPISQEELCTEPSLQAVPTAGDAEEPQDAHGVQQPVLAELQELSTRARSASESSTASLEEDSQTSSDSPAEELEGTSEDKSFGFRWFGWFRSKPQKETSPKATTSGSPTPGLQDRRSPSPPGAVPSAQPPASPSPYRNPVSIDMKGPWDADGHEPLPGMVPLFNPAQVSQLAAARPTQPRLLSQRRYPNPL